jgi:hypothetical protein
LKKVVTLFLLVFVAGNLFSQDTLPKFTLVERGDRVVISWVNPFANLVQLNVQRSYDSLRNFVTIFSPTSPALTQNGYTDSKSSSTTKVFYRIFYVVQGGEYFFTKSKRAGGTTSIQFATRDLTYSTTNTAKLTNIDPNDNRLVTIKLKDAVLSQLPAFAFKHFKDSILRQTRDTLFAINDSLVSIHPFVLREVWKASNYIFVNKDGYINISLPKVEERRYHVKFFEENGSSLFEINHVRESPLILDKSIFIHSGWFLFELYEDTKLKEKNKFYLPKDF